jgi:hypothetical protein
MARILFSLFTTILLLVSSTSAQFNFFEQMFQGGQQQQRHEPQNTASDSNWYQQNYEAGKLPHFLPLFLWTHDFFPLSWTNN